jgi:adenylate cyclase class 2
MAATVEREIKLRFETVDAARTAVLQTGATPIRGRRLQEDCLLDTADNDLWRRRCILRVRVESGKSLLTFKGPVEHASSMKMREELETVIADGSVLLRVFEELGLHVWFRYQKYREEFALDDVIVAVDETPLGTFVEIEGGEKGIADMADALGRAPSDYVIESYRTLFTQHCQQHGMPVGHMLFDED